MRGLAMIYSENRKFSISGWKKMLGFETHKTISWKRFTLLTVLLIYLLLRSSSGNASFSSINSELYVLPLKQNETIYFQAFDNEKLYLPLIGIQNRISNQEDGWSMVAANPQRTSWNTEEVTGNLHIEWYRPIEAYIPQNTQIIANYGLLYISTAKGLYALDAANGETVWRFDTELPLGNSPTVSDGVVYVGGFDRKIHALDAQRGTYLWGFSEAKAGFDTNPLVVEEKVIVGNRDGGMYAIGAHGTPNQGQLIWKYQTGGPIHLSAAYKDGVVFFAANDNYAYALNVNTGHLVWKSKQLPGDGYHSYWPVIFQDMVIFSAAHGYRPNMDPGTGSVKDANGDGYAQYHYIERDNIFYNDSDFVKLGTQVADQGWANGYPVIDAYKITKYHEDNPTSDINKYKPWRKVFVVLNVRDGSEFTFDSDNNNFRETIPIALWGTQSGNRYPPIVGPDNILYTHNIYEKQYISQGRVMGWNPALPSLLSVLRGQGAVDEPQSISGGGNIIYRSICVDRLGDWFSITDPSKSGVLWAYHSPLFSQAPGYDEVWWNLRPDDPIRFTTNYGNANGIYDNGGVQTPLVPYDGRLYIHRSNAIVSYGSGPVLGKLSLLQSRSPQESSSGPTRSELVNLLEKEVRKILEAGHLRPGYYNNGQFGYLELRDYFDNPGDTLFTLTRSYPFLSPELKEETKSYLRREFQDYFDPVMYSSIGWADGAAREAMPLPPEVEAALSQFPKRERSRGWSWQYPQHNFYAMWKYAQIFPAEAPRVYDLAKSKLEVPASASTDIFIQRPWELHTYVSGYIGFLNLQDLAGKSSSDQLLRVNVTNELNRLLELRVQIFDKDTPWVDTYKHRRHLNIARNFMFVVPEVGEYMHQHLRQEVQGAMNEYVYLAPYWFVSRYEAVMDEGIMSNLYNYQALFLAKAYILKEPREELVKYLDVPAFQVGDLHYIQNIIAAIEAGP
jgi:outer membrane protein assembly factor BamB